MAAPEEGSKLRTAGNGVGFLLSKIRALEIRFRGSQNKAKTGGKAAED